MSQKRRQGKRKTMKRKRSRSRKNMVRKSKRVIRKSKRVSRKRNSKRVSRRKKKTKRGGGLFRKAAKKRLAEEKAAEEKAAEEKAAETKRLMAEAAGAAAAKAAERLEWDEETDMDYDDEDDDGGGLSFGDAMKMRADRIAQLQPGIQGPEPMVVTKEMGDLNNAWTKAAKGPRPTAPEPAAAPKAAGSTTPLFVGSGRRNDDLVGRAMGE